MELRCDDETACYGAGTERTRTGERRQGVATAAVAALTVDVGGGGAAIGRGRADRTDGAWSNRDVGDGSSLARGRR